MPVGALVRCGLIAGISGANGLANFGRQVSELGDAMLRTLASLHLRLRLHLHQLSLRYLITRSVTYSTSRAFNQVVSEHVTEISVS